MNNQISWVFELTLNNSANELKQLMLKLVESTKKEPQTLAYEWYLSVDEKICHIYEKYENSEAAILHLATFKKEFASSLLALGQATYFVVYGNCSKDLLESLEGFNGQYMNPIGGF